MSWDGGILARRGNCELRDLDVPYIRRFLRSFTGLSRTETILTLCEHLGWTTAAGTVKYEVGRELLEQAEASGAFALPARRARQGAAAGCGRSPGRSTEPVAEVSEGAPVRGRLAELAPVRLRFVTGPEQVDRFNAYLARFHPLGYRKPFGFSGRYFIEAGGQALGCILLGGPARALAARDRCIGWTPAQRRQRLAWVVNNSRFLIFPWVEVPHLASHALGRLARQLADDYQRCWGFRPVLLETFVDPAHYRGSCYRAAGWRELGQTSGQGLARPGRSYRSTPKRIFVKPLSPQWRELLCRHPRAREVADGQTQSA